MDNCKYWEKVYDNNSSMCSSVDADLLISALKDCPIEYCELYEEKEKASLNTKDILSHMDYEVMRLEARIGADETDINILKEEIERLKDRMNYYETIKK